MKIVQKGVRSCMALLAAVRARVSSVLQSEEAKAFGKRVKTEAGKDTARLSRALQQRALGVITESERKLNQAKVLLKKRKK